jgi:hypothetical protein
LRALKANDNVSCPGETICLTDRAKGVCARRAARSADESAEEILERICHADAGGCKLFGTKPENTPDHLVELIESVEYLRRRSAQGFEMPPLDELGVTFMAAYDGADDSHNLIANESAKTETGNGASNPPAISPASPFAQAFPHLVR